MSVHANSTATDTGRQKIMKTVLVLGPKGVAAVVVTGCYSGSRVCYSASNRLLQLE